MIKNILALIGLVVVVGKGYEAYRRYCDMRAENDCYRQRRATGDSTAGQ